MIREDLIPVSEFCTSHEIEFSFIHSLNEFGLIKITTIRETAFLHHEELPKLEQILLFNKELEINLEGVEVIIRLLEQVNSVQKEINALKNKLRLYENL